MVRKIRQRSVANRGGDSAWKRAERKVAKFFLTERTGRGAAGADQRYIAPMDKVLQSWGVHLPGFDEPFDGFVVESKCRKTLKHTLERFHDWHIARKDKNPIPVMLGRGVEGQPIALTPLNLFPHVYRELIAPPAFHRSHLDILGLFDVLHYHIGLPQELDLALGQAERDARDMEIKLGRSPLLPLAFLTYPVRVTDLIAFKVPEWRLN